MLKLFISALVTLNTLVSPVRQVFFAFVWDLLSLPLFFSTRAYTYTHTRIYACEFITLVFKRPYGQTLPDTKQKSEYINRLNTRVIVSRVFLFAIGLSLVLSLGYNLARPIVTAAATTNTVNFQARLESSDGAIAPDGNYNVEFKIYSSASGGSALWVEDHLVSASQSVVVSNGYLTVNLGSVTSFPSNMPWDKSLYTTMNIGGLTSTPSWDGEMNPRLLLTAVPYAFQAANATELQITNGLNVATLSFASAPTTAVAILLPNNSGTVCLDGSTACSFAPTTGGSGYIQNGLSLQTNANYNIQSTATTSITSTITAFPSQTADLLRFENSAGTAALSGVNSNGNYYIQSGSYTGTIAQTSLTSGSATYDLPNYAGTQTLCSVESGNCGGSGGGVTTSTGVNNFVPVFSGSNTLRVGSIVDNGSGNVQIGNTTFSSPTALLAVGSANQLTVGTSGNLTTSGIIQGISLDANSAAGLTVGGTNATSLTLGKTGVNTTVAGQLTLGSLGAAANNTNVCYGTGGLISSCANSYVQSNPSATQTGNFYLQPLLANTVGGIIKGAVSQTANLLNLTDSASNILAGFNASGNLTLGNSSSLGKIVFGDGSSSNKLILNTTTLTGADTVQIPDTAGSTDTLCLKVLANCAGSGGGVTTTTGVTHALAVFSGSTTLGIGSIYDNQAGNVQIGNSTYSSPTALLAVGASNQLTVSSAGALITSGSIQGLSLDSNTAAGLTIGGNNATSLILGKSAVGTTIAGSLTLSTVGAATNNTNICSNSGIITTCSNNYVQSNPGSAQTGNINLQSSGSVVVGAVIRGALSQIADLLDLNNNGGTVQFGVSSSGNVSGGTYNTATISGGTLTATSANGLNISSTTVGGTGALTVSSGGLGDLTLTSGNALTVTSSNFNTTASGINSTAIGATTASTGAFSSLSSTGNATLATAGGYVGIGGASNNGELSVLSSSSTTTGLYVQSATSNTAPVATFAQGGTGTGDLLDLKTGATAVAKFDYQGNLTAVNGAFSGNVSVGTSAVFTNNGATLNGTLALINPSGTIGTAAATVDIYSSLTVTESTASVVLGVPNPTNTAAGRVVFVSNTGTNSFTIAGSLLIGGGTSTLYWNGSSWTFAGSGGNSIQNQNVQTQSGATFWIGSVGRSDTAFYAPLFDTAIGGTLAIGQSNATAVTIYQNTNINGSKTLTVGTGLTTLGGGLTVSSGHTFTNSSSTLNTSVALGPSINGAIGAASSTVDIATSFSISAGSAGLSLTVPSPTITTAGRIIYATNTGSFSFNLNGAALSIGSSATLVWDGSSWDFSGAGASSVQNQNSSQQTANFWISGSGRTDTSLLTPLLDSNPASSTLTIGGANASSGIILAQSTSLNSGKQFTNNGSTLYGACNVATSASNYTLTASTTVDSCSYITLTQNTSGITATIPNPTVTTAGKTVYLSTIGSAAVVYLSVNSNVVAVGAHTGITLLWDGSAWVDAGVSENNIVNQALGTTAQSANFVINGSGQANTSFLTPLLDTPLGITTLNIGTTNATAGINLNQNTTIASGKTLTIATGSGGITLNGSGTVFTNNGTTINGACNVATNGSSYTMTASTTVDSCGYITLTQNTTGITVTLPSPTTTTGGKTTYISSIGSAAIVYISAGSKLISLVPHSSVTLIWDGTTWNYAGTNFGNIVNEAIGSTAQTANFVISGTGQANTSFLTPLLDTPSGTTTLNIGSTNASAGINLNQNVTIAFNKTLSFATSTFQAIQTITTAQMQTAGQAGNWLNIAAGQGYGTGIGSGGGPLTLSAGSAAGTGNNAGGSLYLNGGTKTGTGTNGAVLLQNINGGNVGLGTTTFTNTLGSNNLVINSGTSGIAGIQFTQLTSASSVNVNPGTGVLSVDANGNIILVGGGGGGGSGAATVNSAIDGTAGYSGGAQIISGVLYMQSATASVPGLVNIGAQSFAGNKIFGGTSTFTGLATTNGGLTNSSGNPITNSGTTINTPCNISNTGSSYTMTASTTVDSCTYITLTQNAPGITVTVPNPTVTTAGKTTYISTIGSAAVLYLSVNSNVIAITPHTAATLIWDGTTWNYAGTNFGNIVNEAIGSTAQTANFVISGTGQANTSFLTPLLDTPSGTTTLNIGSTNASAGINLNQNVVVATGKNLSFASTTTTQTHTISLVNSVTAGQLGDTLTLTAGAAANSGTGAGGGALNINGGTAQGTGINNGGNVVLNGGAKTSTGANGAIILQNTNGGNVGLGTTTFTNTLGGNNLVINSGTANVAGIQLTQLHFGSTVGTNPGTGVLSLDVNGNLIFVTDQTGTAGSGVNTIGSIDTGGASANGAVISSTTLYLQSASGTVPGLVNLTGQTFAGAKIFSGAASFSSTTTTTGLATFNGGLTNAASQVLTNNGTTLNTACNVATSGTSYTMTAASTVDSCSYITLTQNTAGITVTVPSPTTTTAGKTVYISNIGTANPIYISANSNVIAITNHSAITLVWDGSNWNYAGTNFGNIVNEATTSTAQTANFNINGTGIATTFNATTGINTGAGTGTLRLNSSGALSAITGYAQTAGTLTQTGGAVTFTQAAASQAFLITETAKTNTDQLDITTNGFGVTTAGVNGLGIIYQGGAAAVESSASRIDLTPGTTSGGTWNGYRLVAANGAASGITENAIKVDAITSTAGTNNAINVGSGWTNILQYNGSSIINGIGVIQSAGISGSYTNISGVGTLIAGSIAPSFGSISTTNTITGSVLGATTGFQISGAATAGNYLRGDGTNFISSAIQATDIPIGSVNYIQNQSSSAQASSNFWISGTGIAATKLQSPIIDAASSGTLQIGLTSGGNATSILLNQTVIHAAGSNESFNASGLTHAISVSTSVTSNASGDGLTLSAGNANGSTTGASGGSLTLNAGNAAGSGANNGGNINISGGTATGAGSVGTIILQGSNGGRVGIGTINPNNTLEVNSGSTGSSGLTFTDLTSASTPGVSNGVVLSVNSSGQVILTNTPGSSAVTSVGTLDANGTNTNGASIASSVIYLQSASGTVPGIVNLAAQTFAGAKTFSTSLSANFAHAGVVAICASTGTVDTAGTFTLSVCNGVPTADYAEAYPVASGATYGDIVATGTNMVNTYGQDANGAVDYNNMIGQVSQLVKTTVPYQNNTIGVVSNNSGNFSSTGHNIKISDNPMSVALNGRVPVNIDPNSAAIVPGDYITTSNIAGLGTKASGPGHVIGKALGNWTANSGQTNVMVYIEPGYYPGPNVASYVQNGSDATLSNLNVSGTASFADLNSSGTATINNLKVITATISGNLTVQGLTTVTDIQVNGHIVTGGVTPIAAATTNAGNTAVCTVSGNDTSGQITITTGNSNWQIGDQCDITFNKVYQAATHPVISVTGGTGATTNTSSINPYVDSTVSGFQLLFNAADSGQHTYIFNYFNAQ